jgi:hypothetical protein
MRSKKPVAIEPKQETFNPAGNQNSDIHTFFAKATPIQPSQTATIQPATKPKSERGCAIM